MSTPQHLMNDDIKVFSRLNGQHQLGVSSAGSWVFSSFCSIPAQGKREFVTSQQI